MLGVIAFHPLPAAEPHVERPPGRQKGWKRSHVLRRCAAAAERNGESRITAFVLRAARSHVAHPGRDCIQRLFPGYRCETRVFVTALLGVRALHRRRNAVRIIGFLDKTVGLYADPAAAGVPVGDIVIGFDPRRYAVLHLNAHQIRSRHALVAVNRNFFPVLDFGRHGYP